MNRTSLSTSGKKARRVPLPSRRRLRLEGSEQLFERLHDAFRLIRSDFPADVSRWADDRLASAWRIDGPSTAA